MRRIFWDTMLLIYLLEDHPTWTDRVLELLRVSRERGDLLFTSHLALGELLAGVIRLGELGKVDEIRRSVDEIGFQLLPFSGDAVFDFGMLRAVHKVKIPDAIHLACASAAKMDLFLTGDKALIKLHIPGIKFIADFSTPLL